MDFRYLGHVPESDDHVNELMEKALELFHEHKATIIDLEACQGKGWSVIENWHIPKLKLMQRVIPNIWANGVAMQWNADHMEHAHITKVKIPARAGNNQQYEPQIARHLNQADKCCRFDLATSVKEAGIHFGNMHSILDSTVDTDDCINTTEDLLDEITPVFDLGGTGHKPMDYFAISTPIQNGLLPNALRPYHTFTSPCHLTAYYLLRDPSMARVSVDATATAHDLSDLLPPLKEYVSRTQKGINIYSIGGW